MDSPTTCMAEMYMIMHGFKTFFYPQNTNDNDLRSGPDPASDEEIFETAKDIYNQLVNIEYPVNLEEERRKLKEEWLLILNDGKPIKEDLFDEFIQKFYATFEEIFPFSHPDSQAHTGPPSTTSGPSERSRAEKFAMMSQALKVYRNRNPSIEDHIKKILNS